MNDGQIWNDFIRKALEPYGVFQRLENARGVGTPDVLYCIHDPENPGVMHGHTGFIELKVVHGEEGDRRYLILQRTQIPWHAARARIAPNNYWFVAYGEDTRIYLIRGSELLRMPNETMGERHNKFMLIDGLVKYQAKRAQFDWQRLISHLAHR